MLFTFLYFYCLFLFKGNRFVHSLIFPFEGLLVSPFIVILTSMITFIFNHECAELHQALR